jgi:ribosomal protein S18 acetylase RimI-like enzyme
MQPAVQTDTCRVEWEDSAEGCVFRLAFVPLAEPHAHRYEHIDAEWVETYLRPAQYAFGAYTSGELCGFLIAERRDWNQTLWVWEFHVAAEMRGQGIGRRLMEHAADWARRSGLRAIVCETQNRNASAIRAYHGLGFRLEGVDISYYTNRDYPDGDVAVFMKRRLT